MIAKKILIPSVLLIALILGSAACTPEPGFNERLEEIARPYGFSILAWEATTLPRELTQLVFGRGGNVADEVRTVTEYFTMVESIISLKSRIRAVAEGTQVGDLVALEAELSSLQAQQMTNVDTVERILEKQIKAVLAEQDIFNPLDNYARPRINFPPLNFQLEKPPQVLVISPRDRIESIREIILEPDLSLEEITAIESASDELGVSSLVIEIGGLGSTYPSFVTNEASLRFTLNAATEEWLHQYLFFRPLGFLYALDLTGISPNYEIATINETVASMASKEIGALVYEKHYAGFDNPTPSNSSGFDFNREMRTIRRTVDEYLAQGEIGLAEDYMTAKRQHLADNGYFIRKLNQAYFAFHGVYADSPTSISPIGVELAELRAESASLKEFLISAAAITSREQLQDLLE